MGFHIYRSFISNLFQFLQRIPWLLSIIHRAQAQGRIICGVLSILGCLLFGFFANQMNKERIQADWNVSHFPSVELFQAILEQYHLRPFENSFFQNEVSSELMLRSDLHHSVWVTEDWNWVAYDLGWTEGRELLLYCRGCQKSVYSAKEGAKGFHPRARMEMSNQVKWKFLATGWEGLKQLLEGLKQHPERANLHSSSKRIPQMKRDPREMIY